MTQGAPDSPVRGLTGLYTMTDNSDKERGEKRGVLSTGRARKTQDATADADNSTEDSDEED